MGLITQKIDIKKLYQEIKESSPFGDLNKKKSKIDSYDKLRAIMNNITNEYDLDDNCSFYRKGLVPTKVEIKADNTSIEKGERDLIVTITTLEKDRDEEVVLPEGAQLKDYYRNNIVLFCHDYWTLPVGMNKWINPDQKKNPSALVARSSYAPTTQGTEIYNYRAGGFPLAESIGFIPLEWVIPDDEEWDDVYDNWRDRYLEYALKFWQGIFDDYQTDSFDKDVLVKLSKDELSAYLTNEVKTDYASDSDDLFITLKKGIPKEKDNPRLFYTKWILLEYSDVPVPSNPSALALAVSKSIITPDMAKRYNNGVDIDEVSSKEMIKDIKVEENEIGDSNEDKEQIEKKIGGKRDLPTSDKETWNGSAAVERMRVLAGGPDKDDINWTKYRRGFVWYDPDDAENYGSYKLPFADVEGETLTAIWGGVAAAMGAVLGTRGGVDLGSEGERKSAYNFLSSYYKKFDKEPPKFKKYTTEELTDVDSVISLGADSSVIIHPVLYSWIDTIKALTEENSSELTTNIMKIVSSDNTSGEEIGVILSKKPEIIDITNREKDNSQKKVEIKEGRVLSTANRKRLKKVADGLQEASGLLMELYEATDPDLDKSVESQNDEIDESEAMRQAWEAYYVDQHRETNSIPEIPKEFAQLFEDVDLSLLGNNSDEEVISEVIIEEEKEIDNVELLKALRQLVSKDDGENDKVLNTNKVIAELSTRVQQLSDQLSFRRGRTIR